MQLDDLMRKPPLYNKWQLIFFGGMCSASICSVSFSGSFIDCLISFPLGCILIVIQLFAAKHELYSNVFEYVPRSRNYAPLTHDYAESRLQLFLASSLLHSLLLDIFATHQ